MLPGVAPGVMMPVSTAQVSAAASSASGTPTTATAPRPLFPAAAAQVCIHQIQIS